MESVMNQPAPLLSGHPLVVRIGIHSGSVIAGVVGRKCARYHLFGETVSVAEEMEQHGIAGKVVISEATRQSMLQGMSAETIKEYELEWIDPLVRPETSPSSDPTQRSSNSNRVLHRYIVRKSRGRRWVARRGRGAASRRAVQ